MKKLLWVALCVWGSGCSCGGPSTPKDLYYGLTDALCTWEARCGAIGKSEQSQCVSAGHAYFDRYLFAYSAYDLDAAIQAKRLEIDSGEAGKCIDAYKNLPCAGFSNFAAISGACAHVYRGLVALGGACQSSYECTKGFCDPTAQGNACSGVCVAFAAEGAACTTTSRCDTSIDFCDSSGVCRPRGAVGAACTSSFFGTDCKDGLACSNGTCSGPASAGQPCPTGLCADGLHCAPTASGTQVCAASVGKGQACSDPYACPDGQRCSGLTTPGSTGTCKDILDVGGTCTPTDLLCPSDAPCDSATMRCTAVTTGKEGSSCATASCSSSSVFAPPLYCDATTHLCTEKKVPGEACSAPDGGEDPCTTTCDATSHCTAATGGCN